MTAPPRWLSILILVASAALAQTSAALADPITNVDPCLGKPGFEFILRQDFTDVPILGCSEDSTSLKTAVGTRLSYLYDDIHNSSAVSLDGLVALNIQYSIPGLSEYLSRISFGPFAQGAGMHTFATAASPPSTSGAVTSGGFVQFFLQRPLPVDHDIPVILRFRGGELADSTGVRDGAAVAEVIPAFELSDLLGPNTLPRPIGAFLFGSEYQLDNGLKFIFSPEIEAQYDSYQTGPLTYALFANHHESMRLGPLLVLKLYGFEDLFGVPSPLRQQIQKMALSLSYHADWDTLSNQRYYNFQTAFIYNFDDKGNYALTTSYSLGDSESSGNRMRQVKVAFAAKF